MICNFYYLVKGYSNERTGSYCFYKAWSSCNKGYNKVLASLFIPRPEDYHWKRSILQFLLCSLPVKKWLLLSRQNLVHCVLQVFLYITFVSSNSIE
jgi:hypothetical protein